MFIQGINSYSLGISGLKKLFKSQENSLDRFCVILKGREKVVFERAPPMYKDAASSLLAVNHKFDLEGQVTGFDMHINMELR